MDNFGKALWLIGIAAANVQALTYAGVSESTARRACGQVARIAGTVAQ